ncbi:MAG: pteridine reductase [Gammaproteobacteria bacterium]|nr:pteridine reductase [Gammaproteobacteria bacterium]NIM72509.1 pteridine reductase [Gammaproteobacteria bacterium]NIO24268.1 pteridine reductase [Gammaproteobacteria bacterium]NIO64873.1 pteridine reductase [Gammaproteobacteria bacterium]NIP44918.1 pteridine reductase [Gammaproteobacteria bacterium]
MSHAAQPASPAVALVTGGARRIGAAIVRRLHDAGFQVAVHYNSSRDEAQALCDALDAARPGSALPFAADLREIAAIGALVDAVADAFARIDVLVNNASSYFATPLGRIDEGAYRELLDTNLTAPLFLSQAAAPMLARSGGSIVNIADIYASMPIADHAAYCAAKAGLVMMTRALAVDLAPDVRVNAVAPGAILWPEGSAGEEDHSAVLAQIPLGRTGSPADIAEAVLFLARDAHYMTGQVIKVDGGRAIG